MKKDIFEDMRKLVGCDYQSQLPYHKHEVWQHIKTLPLSEYPINQLQDFSCYVFGMKYEILLAVMKQQKGRDSISNV